VVAEDLVLRRDWASLDWERRAMARSRLWMERSMERERVIAVEREDFFIANQCLGFLSILGG
jgi:hypothetical protein